MMRPKWHPKVDTGLSDYQKGNTIMTRNVAILIFDEVEVLDFCGPFEVFGVAGLHSTGERPFYVYTIAEKSEPVSARNGLSINPNFTIADCPQPDILLVPGGRGTRGVIHNDVWFTHIITWFPIIVTRWLRQPPNGLEARDTMRVNRGDDGGKQYRMCSVIPCHRCHTSHVERE
jgi:hypothetical protein